MSMTYDRQKEMLRRMIDYEAGKRNCIELVKHLLRLGFTYEELFNDFEFYFNLHDIEYTKKDMNEYEEEDENMAKMRMYFHILGTKPYYKEVSSVEVAKTMIDTIADFVNAKVEEGVFPYHCSTAGLEEYDEEEKEWMTWYDENGLDFDEHFIRESDE